MKRDVFKSTKFGFTLVELLVVIGIIALLMAISMPVLRSVRIASKVTMDTAGISSMGIAIEAFKSDIGYYPPSNTLPMNVSYDLIRASGDPGADDLTQRDTGAHRLFEALCGLDTLGYEKNGHYETDDEMNDIDDGTPVAFDRFDTKAETKRWGPYLELKNINFGPVSKAYSEGSGYGTENSNNVFLSNINPTIDRPVLYYRANKLSRVIAGYDNFAIYNYDDNRLLTQDYLGGNNYHPDLDDDAGDLEDFTRYFWDPTTGFGQDDNEEVERELRMNSSAARPHNKDTYVLINAGPDGLYGTYDDITNYKVKK